MIDSSLYTFVKTHRMNLGLCNVNYGLWVMMTGQCSFVSYNTCTTLVQGVDNEGRSHACVESGV